MLKQSKFDRLKRRVIRRPFHLSKDEYKNAVIDWLSNELSKDEATEDAYLFEVDVSLKYADKITFDTLPF